MVKKGKKKKTNTQKETASTSKDNSNKQLHKKQDSQKEQTQDLPQKPSDSSKQSRSQSQLQGAQDQQISHNLLQEQQQQIIQKKKQSTQTEVASTSKATFSEQQKQTSQQKKQVKQVAQDLLQKPSDQLFQAQPQLQEVRDQWQQQQHYLQQQQQKASSFLFQQSLQGIRVQSQQEQQVLQSLPLQQQQSKVWNSQPRRRGPLLPQQQQKIWVTSQHPGTQGLQQQGILNQSQQPGIQASQLKQQGAWDQSQASQVDISANDDSKLVTDKASMIHSDIQQQQSTTSAQSKLFQLSLRDTLNPTKTSQKEKMTSSVMKQYQLSIPKRKDPKKAGTIGESIDIYTNMFEIIFDTNFVTNAVHYDVNITPALKAWYRKVFEQCRINNFKNRYPAFDGKKNAYSANDLPFIDFMETDIELYDSECQKQRTFKIILKKVANIDLSWIKNLRPGFDEADRNETGTQVLDIIMRHAPESRYLSIGRSLFWEIDDVNISVALGDGLKLFSGGFSSAILGWKPFLNIDVAYKPFPTSQNVVNLMSELAKKRFDQISIKMNKTEIEIVEKFLKNLKIIYQIPGNSRKRRYRLNGLGPSAVQCRFKYNGTMITVAKYFAQIKNYNLHYPNLPCLWVGPTNKEEKTYLPPELCTIVEGQSINRNLNSNQINNMIKYTKTSAPIRKKNIQNVFEKIKVNDSLTMKQEFHLSVSSKMKKVTARILPVPKLQYNGRVAEVNKGVWQMQTFQKATQEVGMCIEKAQTPFKSLRSQNNIIEIREYFKLKKDLNLIIVIIPNDIDIIYSQIKQIAELEIGILTQCIKFKTFQKLHDNVPTLKNILLKINSKLNGVNHTINSQSIPYCLKNNDCMLVGADVTHPSSHALNVPSVAAVAASSNATVFQYNIMIRLQQPKEEIIIDLEEIIISQLLIYREKTSRLPNKIIYYRDGVSEGQLSQVMYFEINAIKRACKRSKADNIQITCLVVQKRHNVRFFLNETMKSNDRNQNVKAGTIVDTEITHPNHIDFYLVSHTSIQGTARPTKYRCICNESNFTENNIEELTYFLCHMCARCTRAISYPTPTYYAHLGAYRGRILIQERNICLDNLDGKQLDNLRMTMKRSPMHFI